MTGPYAEVIGDPIAHSKSPLIHKFWLTKLGIDADYRAKHLRPDELEDYFARRRADAEWRGCNVTIPYKEVVAQFLDACSTSAEQIGAVNSIHRTQTALSGHNTDTDGIEASLKGVEPSSLACIIGAGGAARAALAVLDADSRIIGARILARSLSKRNILKAEFGSAVETYGFDDTRSAMSGIDLLINASPLGMSGFERMPEDVIDWLAHAHPCSLVFDMVYTPLDTELLLSARAAGLRTVDGLQMLIGQAAAAFELFFGQPAPREHEAELRALLTL